MGLADLKKNVTPSEVDARKRMLAMQSLDEFIDGAIYYAMGQTQQSAATMPVEQRYSNTASTNQEATQQKLIPKRRHEPFRKATFTLSEAAISHLAEMACDCDIAKSRLIRLLIQHHHSLTPQERRELEQKFMPD
ncbi:CopG family transcriptional regulator [Shewanella algae]|uniref:CopG family transcriptional regulator n=1 Tax=Shewanella algae TaxID=38313 RepID=UPI001AAD5EE3|nr:CopG family transcriptional regulator [Shewanella algae]MBO2556115.1 CopG family transcriptional regulator [Shewanella algae]MBO2573048.1 CopG family transcriptional regulator [Shewanella algae]